MNLTRVSLINLVTLRDLVTPNNVESGRPPPSTSVIKFKAQYRVDCKNTFTNRVDDSTITAYSEISVDDAKRYILDRLGNTDLFQNDGDTSRVMIAGSGRWL
jgi:hypothetical protein